uniref:Uncharacterized protein n=1 Tax=Aegilops tauschii TaxID=37682 RepID=M8C358_AEGTA
MEKEEEHVPRFNHPTESLAVRKAAAEFKSLGGIGNKVKLAYTMLNLPSWEKQECHGMQEL